MNVECGYKSRHNDPLFYFLIFIFHFSIAIEKESLNLVAKQLKINLVEYTSASYFIAFIRCFILFVCILERFAELLTARDLSFILYKCNGIYRREECEQTDLCILGFIFFSRYSAFGMLQTCLNG